MNEIKQLRGITDFRELCRKRSFTDIWDHDVGVTDLILSYDVDKKRGQKASK